MATDIRLKKSSVAGRIPDSSDLAYGELALNYADEKLYFKNSSNVIKTIGGGTDSAAILQLIDSDYVLNRSSASFPILNQDSSLSHYEKMSFTVLTNNNGVIVLQPQVTYQDSGGSDVTINIDLANAGLDSAQAIDLIDSNYITARAKSLEGNITITTTDAGSTAGPELILYRNSSSPADGDYLGQIQFKGRHDGPGDEVYAKVTGKISDASSGTEDGLIETAIKGNGSFTIVSRQKSNELQLLNGVGLSVDGSLTLGGETVDSSWVQARQSPGTDSAAVIALITANAIDSGVALQLLLDSSEVVQLIDSSYVQARQSGGEITIQEEGSALSTAATTLNFVGSGVTATGTGTTKTITISGGGGGGGTTGSFNQVSVNSYTGDSSTTAFTLSQAPTGGSENNVVVTINGVVQHTNSYSLSGTTVTLDSAPETGDEIEMRVHDDYSANIQLRDYKSYVYTPSSSTTAFTGSDDNGATLTYDAGKVEVYLNGSRLVSGTDYTETNSSTITLGEAIDSPDTLEIISLAKAAIADFGVAAYDSDLSSVDSGQILHTFPAASFRTVKYIAQIEHDSDNKYHSEEILLAHNGTTVGMTTYSQILLDSSLGTFDADISGTDVRLKFTPTYTNTSVKLRAIRVNA